MTFERNPDMHFTTSKFFCCLLLLASAACNKKPSPTAGSADNPPEATATASTASTSAPEATPSNATQPPTAVTSEAPLPATFMTFERLLLPLVKEPESEARNVKTCKMLEELRIASLALRRDVPKGVDATAWEAASNEMRGAFEGLGGVCMDDPPGFSSDLDIVHESYQRLRKLLPTTAMEPDEEHVVPDAFLKFEDLMRPLVRQAPSKLRSAKTCGELPKFEVAMLAITQAAPKQVDRGQWEAASKGLQDALASLKATCAKNPPSDSPGLGALDVSYVRLHDLLPQ